MRLVKYIKPILSQRSILVILIAATWLFSSLSVNAQQGLKGWERIFGNIGLDETINDIVQTRDEGYVMAGYRPGGQGQLVGYLVKTDVDGTLLWEKEIERIIAFTPVPLRFNAILEAQNGDLIFCGQSGGASSVNDIYVGRYTADGDLLWETVQGTGADDRGNDLIELSNGNIVVVGDGQEPGNRKRILATRLDADGTVITAPVQPNLAPLLDEVARSIIQLSNGSFFIVGYTTNDQPSENREFFFLRTDINFGYQNSNFFEGVFPGQNDEALDAVELPNGEIAIIGRMGNDGDNALLKSDGNTLELVKHFPKAGRQQPQSIILTSDENLVFVGDNESSSLDNQITLTKIQQDGDLIWEKSFGRTGFFSSGFSVKQDIENGFILTGTTSEGAFPNLATNAYLIKTDAQGNSFKNTIAGRVFIDDDNDCVFNATEQGMKGWALEAYNSTLDSTFYGFSQADGSYAILVPHGDYELSVRGPSNKWNLCTEMFSFNISEDYENINRGFALSERIVCPDLEVDISTPFLEPCNTSTYTVTYCNNGTTEAEDATLEVIFDNDLAFASGNTITPTSIIDSLYIFDLGDIAIGECNTFSLLVDVDCAAIASQAHCLKANIKPDDFCETPVNWDGSSIEIEGECDGDQVKFRIKNVGTGIYDKTDKTFIVIEDHIMIRQAPPNNLIPGTAQEISIDANGATYRIIADQAGNHPGNSSPTVAIEGCSPSGNYSVGYLTQFEEDDRNPFVSVDCQENIDVSTYGPFFKRGFPKGYGDDAEIEPETDLKYTINFQNVGIDTAIRMVIRDTLSPWLDPASIRPGASSHDYKMEIYGKGILKFTFENINLPGSSTNEQESFGFVKYRVSQKPDNPNDTKICNSAAIYFDYNFPGYATDVCHTVRDTLDITVSTDQIFASEVNDIKVYPNPFRESATLEIISKQNFSTIEVLIYDAEGRLVSRQVADSNRFSIQRGELTAGMYVYKLRSKEQLISAGKLMVH